MRDYTYRTMPDTRLASADEVMHAHDKGLITRSEARALLGVEPSGVVDD